MIKFLQNQKYLFVVIFGGLIMICSLWYFFIHAEMKEEHRKSRQIRRSLSGDLEKYKSMKQQLTSMQSDWDILNEEFKIIIEKIPDKRLLEAVSDFVYSLIVNNNLKIQSFSPSNAAIEKKTIFLPESRDEVVIEKIPIDITLRGSFINFGKLLESMKKSRYRLTASNIEIIQKESTSAQTIKFITYGYFQTLKDNPTKLSLRPVQKKQSRILKQQKKPNENIKITEAVDQKVSVNDSLKDVPEMWLEPATEPIDETVQSSNDDMAETNDKEIKQKVLPKPELKKNTPVLATQDKPIVQENTSYFYEDFHGIEVLESQICKKVKNNLPISPGKRFTTSIGKVFCHSLLNNKSGKHNDIYHIWYMNGELKAKVRIRVRAGNEIPAISHRVVETNDKGTWKVEITDGDKKILDTVIFEVV